MVSVLALSSDDLSLNPAETYSFFPLKFENQNNKKRPGMANIKKCRSFLSPVLIKKFKSCPSGLKLQTTFAFIKSGEVRFSATNVIKPFIMVENVVPMLRLPYNAYDLGRWL